MEKRLDGNYTRMLRAILNKSWRQHPTKQQLYGHLPPTTKTIQVRRTRHARHCWSKDKLISDTLLWTPSHGRAKTGRPVRTYIQQVCADTGSTLEDLPGAMDDRDGWWERVREIRAGSATWWWYINLLCKKFIYQLAVSGHALLWLSLFKWGKKRRKCMFLICLIFQYLWIHNIFGSSIFCVDKEIIWIANSGTGNI